MDRKKQIASIVADISSKENILIVDCNVYNNCT